MKKSYKRVVSIIAVVMLVIAMCVPAFAAEYVVNVEKSAGNLLKTVQLETVRSDYATNYGYVTIDVKIPYYMNSITDKYGLAMTIAKLYYDTNVFAMNTMIDQVRISQNEIAVIAPSSSTENPSNAQVHFIVNPIVKSADNGENNKYSYGVNGAQVITTKQGYIALKHFDEYEDTGFSLGYTSAYWCDKFGKTWSGYLDDLSRIAYISPELKAQIPSSAVYIGTRYESHFEFGEIEQVPRLTTSELEELNLSPENYNWLISESTSGGGTGGSSGGDESGYNDKSEATEYGEWVDWRIGNELNETDEATGLKKYGHLSAIDFRMHTATNKVNYYGLLVYDRTEHGDSEEGEHRLDVPVFNKEITVKPDTNYTIRKVLSGLTTSMYTASETPTINFDFKEGHVYEFKIYHLNGPDWWHEVASKSIYYDGRAVSPNDLLDVPGNVVRDDDSGETSSDLGGIFDDFNVGDEPEDIINEAMEKLDGLKETGSEFSRFLKSFFDWLPPEVITIMIITCVLIMILAVIRFIRG